MQGQWKPLSIHQQVPLGPRYPVLPGFVRSSRQLAPFFCRYCAAIQHQVLPVQALALVQRSQEPSPQAVPNPLPLPVAQTVPTGLPAAVVHWEILPPTPRGQDIEDTVGDLSIVRTRAPSPCWGWHQRIQDRPLLISELPKSFLSPSLMNIPQLQYPIREFLDKFGVTKRY